MLSKYRRIKKGIGQSSGGHLHKKKKVWFEIKNGNNVITVDYLRKSKTLQSAV